MGDREWGLEREWDDAYDRRVAGIVGVVQEPVVFGLGDGLDLLQVAVGNRIPHRCECLDAFGEGAVRVSENR